MLNKLSLTSLTKLLIRKYEKLVDHPAFINNANN